MKIFNNCIILLFISSLSLLSISIGYSNSLVLNDDPSDEPEQEYYGPINLKFYLSSYDFTEGKEIPYRNGYVFINTIRSSDDGGNLNGYFKADVDGVIYVTTSNLSMGAHITLYQVNPQNSSINLNCKLAKVDGIYQNFFSIPAVSSSAYEVDDLMLRGACH